MADEIAILGAGGLAREVACLIEDVNEAEGQRWTLRGLVDAPGMSTGHRAGRWLVFATDDETERLPGSLTIGIGEPAPRQRLFRRFTDAGFQFPPLVHPTVVVGDAEIGPGVVVCAGNVLTTNVRVLDGAFINLACTIGHDSVIGACTVLNPGVNVSGNVIIEDGVLVGTGASILQGIRIGRGAVVGAGAMVRTDVPEGETVVGVPARPLRKN